MPKPNMGALARSELLNIAFRERPRLVALVWSLAADAWVADRFFQDLLRFLLARRCELQNAEQVKSRSWEFLQERCARRLYEEAPRRSRLAFALGEMLDDELRTRSSRDIDDQSDALRICIDRLPRRSRLLIRLCYAEGKKAFDAARLLNRRPDRIYRDLQRTFERACGCQRKRVAMGRVPLGATATPKNQRLQRLIFRYLDDELVASDADHLNDVMEQNAEARNLFNDIRLYAALLHDLGRTSDHLAQTERPLP